jgi:hypothetical protein
MRTRSARARRIIACPSSRQDSVMCGKAHNCRVANATALFAKTRETLLQAQDCLGPVLGRRITTFTLSRSRFLGFAAAGAFVALSASLPARAEDLAYSIIGANVSIQGQRISYSQGAPGSVDYEVWFTGYLLPQKRREPKGAQVTESMGGRNAEDASLRA